MSSDARAVWHLATRILGLRGIVVVQQPGDGGATV